MKNLFIYMILCLIACVACKDKLDLKPNTGIVLPKSVTEIESILENSAAIINTPGLLQVSSDEYYIQSLSAWEALPLTTSRNASIWNPDIYGGDVRIRDWISPYEAVFYANSVIDLLSTEDISTDIEKKRVMGRALFVRSYAFYTLISLFSKAYDATTAKSDYGIPLKLNSNVEDIGARNSVQESYDRIIKDAKDAAELMYNNGPSVNRNQPSKLAAYSLLARVYLSMRVYDEAELYANKALAIYSTLTNFNNLNTNASSAFTYNSEETIYFTQLQTTYGQITQGINTNYAISPELISLYSPNDLRLLIYFTKNQVGNYYNLKRINSTGRPPFTGLATDEMYLIKAECLARRNQTDAGTAVLNTLIESRMKTGTFLPYTFLNSAQLLKEILAERSRSLVFRSTRWTDVKRLNLEGMKIVLTRKLTDRIYTLEPNSSRYVLPIPLDEIALSGIQQNPR